MVARHLVKLSGYGPHRYDGQTVSVEDVAASLAKVREPWIVALLRAQFAADASGIPLVRMELTTRFARSKHWRRDRLDRLADLAVREHLAPAVCRVCAGEGSTAQEVIMGRPAIRVPCRPCDGRGFRDWPQRTRAAAVGVDVSGWNRRYQGIYGQMQIELRNWVSQGLAQIGPFLAPGSF